METTLYNHKSAAGELPLIPNIVFKSLCWLMENEMQKDADYIIKNYSLVKTQKDVIEILTTKIANKNLTKNKKL